MFSRYHQLSADNLSLPNTPIKIVTDIKGQKKGMIFSVHFRSATTLQNKNYGEADLELHTSDFYWPFISGKIHSPPRNFGCQYQFCQ